MPLQNRGTRALLQLASLVVVIAGLRAAGSVLTPLFVASFLAILSIPPMRRLQRHGVPELAALSIVIFGASLLIVLVTFVISNSVQQFQAALPAYKERLTAITGSIANALAGAGLDVTSTEIVDRFDSAKIMDLAGATASGIVGALSNLVLVLLTMIFILLEANGLTRKVRRIMGGTDADLEGFTLATDAVKRYLSTKTLVSLANGVCAVLLCASLGVDFPLLWGLLAFLFNFIPNIGAIMSGIPPVLLALVQFGWGRAMVIAIGYLVMEIVLGNLVEPRMMGRRLGLSPLVVFLSLVFWGWVWGPVGMLLSVPLTVIVKILLEHTDDFRAVAILLGPSEPEKSSADG